MSATVAHYAVVAGEGAITYGIEHAEFIGQSPSLLLVEPHKRRMQTELLIHSKIERCVQALDEAVSAVRIAAEVCLPHTCYDVVYAVIAGIDGSDGKEEEVPAWHKGSGVGRPFLFLCFDIKVRICQAARRTELRDETDVHTFPRHTSLLTKFLCYLDLFCMPLPIKESEGSHLIKVLECPIEASRAVLAARKNYKCTC